MSATEALDRLWSSCPPVSPPDERRPTDDDGERAGWLADPVVAVLVHFAHQNREAPYFLRLVVEAAAAYDGRSRPEGER